MIRDKRKADVLGANNISGRPYVKRAATTTNVAGIAHEGALSTDTITNRSYQTCNDKSWTQHQTITPPSTPLKEDAFTLEDVDMDKDDSPSILNFQHSIDNFYTHHSHILGQAHQSRLYDLHATITSNDNFNSTLNAGEAFIEGLHEYVQDLQQAAVHQIQWRASITSTGPSREVLAATDTILSQLDAQIIGIGAEAERLMQEMMSLRDQQ